MSVLFPLIRIREVRCTVVTAFDEIMPGIASATGLMVARIRPVTRPKAKVFLEASVRQIERIIVQIETFQWK